MLRWILLRLLRRYQLHLRPRMAPRCVYHPSCSDYAILAIEKHGAALGLRLTLGRIYRCRPGLSGEDLPWSPIDPNCSGSRTCGGSFAAELHWESSLLAPICIRCTGGPHPQAWSRSTPKRTAGTPESGPWQARWARAISFCCSSEADETRPNR